ncbi:DNA polymerase III subunit gamma/tau [Aerococcus kribbianus]|uniref:DNA-directed DNA polymerase n=1 Tax=Aerococcus kribbianus TaxID=2999064 RepID=A0A9X3FVY9_9LACT|nr:MULTISPECIES: DNA polymerase III subunit gamma/tau [unclassified Aerococcus]MCZ0717912.1 DNA polymerase III subunit gamma/tau [Aerococcus sp. YH-aer221]MCZ0726199.1 DNA polymerase III subunit gamma/tau [Aerococcus sp. YH-aer222]
MTYQALYRVWRPQKFSDIVGQEAVATTLRNAIRTHKTSHAYLFSGPRGTGKTSAAKIFAKAINCPHQEDGEPCNDCEICRAITEGSLSDVIEIDAASNNGVEEIRDIRDKVRYAPTQADYKVYIIDEVHMLSTGAFNALLKTLEEPPANVIFILATTEPHKIPATIISRTQRFDFKRINHREIESRMAYILDDEGIDYEVGSLAVIARAAHGGMRDALSLLDQVISFSGDTISLETTREITGTLSEELLVDFNQALVNGQVASALSFLQDMLRRGQDAKRFVEEELLFVRDLLMAKEMAQDATELLTQRYDDGFYLFAKAISVEQINRIMAAFKDTQQEIRFTLQAEIYLEVVSVQLAHDLPKMVSATGEEAVGAKSELAGDANQALTDLQAQVKDLQAALAKQGGQGASDQSHSGSAAKAGTKPRRNHAPFKPNYGQIYKVLSQASRTDLDQVKAIWQDLVASLPSLQAALLEQTYPAAASSHGFVVRFDYDILCQKLSDNPEAQAEIEATAEKMLGHPSKMLVLTSDQWDKTRQKFAQAYKAGKVNELLGETRTDDQATPTAMTQADPDLTAAVGEDSDADQADDMVQQAVDLFGEESVTVVDD